MSTSPESTAQHGSTHDSESSSGFRSFWKKSDQGAQGQNLTFVQQDPASKRKTSKIGRFFKNSNSTSPPENGEPGNPPGVQKRRQQVYQAQKRHRNRKAEYVQSLEAEVARLQHLDAMINSEKNSLAHQNNAIRDLLANHSIDAQLESVDLGSSSQSMDELSQLGTVAVDIRYDPDLEQERTYIDLSDFSDMMWTSDETSTDAGRSAKRPARQVPVAGDSWAALDFILALEYPCRSHVKHHAINPHIEVPTACAIGAFHGHALTMTAAVYESSQPPPTTKSETLGDNVPNQKGLDPSTANKWQLPHSEIDKLVELAEQLELDEDWMTPVQVYSVVRANIPNDKFLRPTLESLKKPLGSHVSCHGFGACLGSSEFWQHFDSTVETLKFTRPELV